MNKDELKEALIALEPALDLVGNLSPRAKRDIDDIEVVFIDFINGKPKFNRAYNFPCIVEELANGGTVIGVLLVNWSNANNTKVIPVKGIPDSSLELLSHALAEAQDEIGSMAEGDDE